MIFIFFLCQFYLICLFLFLLIFYNLRFFVSYVKVSYLISRFDFCFEFFIDYSRLVILVRFRESRVVYQLLC
jgi:hypothetical protein